MKTHQSLPPYQNERPTALAGPRPPRKTTINQFCSFSEEPAKKSEPRSRLAATHLAVSINKNPHKLRTIMRSNFTTLRVFCLPPVLTESKCGFSLGRAGRVLTRRRHGSEPDRHRDPRTLLGAAGFEWDACVTPDRATQTPPGNESLDRQRNL